ncbi:MAG: hypothetical protein Q8L37_07605 [Candidatus Gottesmanbacteria bacterium]|nr:hypothetical protein [Candidatus Gottesmanbacteria bacterium]
MSIKKLIIFVDRGDIARAPIAAAIVSQNLNERNLQNLYSVISFRTQGYAPDDKEPIKFPNITYYRKQYLDSERWLNEHNIDLSSRWSTAINSWFAEKAKVIFAMDTKTRRSLLLMFPNCEGKVHTFSEIVREVKEIDDPEFAEDRQGLEQIYNGIENTIVNGFPRLLSLTDGINVKNLETADTYPRKEQK